MTASIGSCFAAMSSAAAEAGALVAKGFRQGAGARKKGAIDLVTDFDMASQALIVQRLGELCPGVALVAEEGRETRLGQEGEGDSLCFYVDPIDGTTNFAHGHPFFAVSIGLCQGRSPVAGVVFAPALGLTWTGVVGQGAWRNGEGCRVSTCGGLSDALCATGFGYDVVGSDDDNVREFRAIQNQVRGVRRCGAASLDLALVADGTYDAYWEYLLQPWDLAGGAALVLAAGGRVSDFGLGPVDLMSGAILASNGPVHEPLAKALVASRGGRPVPVH